MGNKLIYWIPIVGVFVSLIHYERENGMRPIWAYYQAAALVVVIRVVAYLQSSH